VIRLEGIEKRFGHKVALGKLDLSVPKGRIVALVGANGAGKSTALQIAAGQVIPDAGRVVLGGCDLASDPLGARRALGYLPQESPLPRALTVVETIEFFAAIRGAAEADAGEAMRLAGLDAESKTLVRELSGGMRRKLAFATAILGGATAIVLDEPFAGLDEASVVRFEDALRRRREEAGILVANHDLERTLDLADEVVALRSGNVVHRGASIDILPGRLREILGGPASDEASRRD